MPQNSEGGEEKRSQKGIPLAFHHVNQILVPGILKVEGHQGAASHTELIGWWSLAEACKMHGAEAQAWIP